MPLPEEPQPSDESALLTRAIGGDLNAYSALVRLHHGGVRAYLAVRLSNIHDAEDLAQEAFVIAFQRIREFDPARPFGPWLRGIALNLYRNHRRKFRADPVGGSAELQDLVDAVLERRNPGGREAARLSALRDCLDQLDGPARTLLTARYGEGVSVRDLAGRSGRGYSALTMQLHRLRELLSECIERRMVAS